MNITVKQIDASLPKPKYHTSGSVAFDLMARIDVSVAPMQPTIIPMNVVIRAPKGYMVLLAARSSLPLKMGLMVANGIGVIDQDYCGEDDEIGLQVVNITKKTVLVKKGDRLAQVILVKIAKAEKIKFVKKMSDVSRGGFGSTG